MKCYKVNAVGFLPSYYDHKDRAESLYKKLAKMVVDGKLGGTSIQEVNNKRLAKDNFRYGVHYGIFY